jgi:hypothetical protein
MEIKKSIKKRRVGVILTLLSLCSMVIIFEYCKIEQRDSKIIAIEIIPLIIFLVSFIVTFIKTGLWGFIHKPLKKLDEREIALTSKSLRYAYSIFTVVTLFLLLSFAITQTQIDVVLVASLILFAHILPASYIAWTEKEI